MAQHTPGNLDQKISSIRSTLEKLGTSLLADVSFK